MADQDVTDVFVERVRGEIDARKDLSQAKLASQVSELLGRPFSRDTVTKLLHPDPSKRRGSLTVEEVIAFALALGTSPTKLLFPDDANRSLELATGRGTTAGRGAAWFAGLDSIEGNDAYAALDGAPVPLIALLLRQRSMVAAEYVLNNARDLAARGLLAAIGEDAIDEAMRDVFEPQTGWDPEEYGRYIGSRLAPLYRDTDEEEEG